MAARLAAAATLTAALALGSACGGDEPEEREYETGGTLCTHETRATPWEPPLEEEGANGLVKVRLLESEPAPPADTDNRWVVQVVDAAGTPLTDAEITRVEPRMPDHGHGSAVPTTVTPEGAEGRFVLNPVNLGMAGYWTIDVDVRLAGGETDTVQFRVCVEG